MSLLSLVRECPADGVGACPQPHSPPELKGRAASAVLAQLTLNCFAFFLSFSFVVFLFCSCLFVLLLGLGLRVG